MAGARIDVGFDDTVTRIVLGNTVRALDNPRPLLAMVREHLLRIHRQRFQDQKAPGGTPWQALSPRYLRRKKRNSNRILVLRGYLMNLLRGILDDEGLLFGTDRVYGAIHHFGGEIQHAARSQFTYFKRGRDGAAGNRFVKKSKSDFAQPATIGEHATRIPARPWLGTSREDDQDLVQLARDYLNEAMSRR